MAYEMFIGDKVSCEDRLNGTIVMGPFDNNGLPVGGRTLIFNSPVGTVTFTGAVGDNRTLAEIVAQIKAAMPTLSVTKRTEHNAVVYSGSAQVSLAISLDAGITIDNLGTANPHLRISAAADTVGRPVTAQGKIASLSHGATPGHYVILINLV